MTACWSCLVGVPGASAAPPPPVSEYPITQIFEGGIGPAAWGPEGYLWFVQSSGREPRGFVERISQTGQVTGETELKDVGPTDIVQGPDGNMWFTEQAFGPARALVGMTPAEKPAGEFPAGDDGAFFGGPLAIAVGPDGRLWFTDTVPDEATKKISIGRATFKVGVTKFAIPLSGGGGIATVTQPQAIATGPGNALWFTDQGHTADGHNLVGRITTSGEVTEFPVPSIGAEPTGIAEGSDGNMWFTEPGVSKIARVTEGGQVTEFPVPGVVATINNLALAPDGNLWFAANPPAVGWITPTGAVGSFDPPFPTEGAAEYLLPGPGEQMWFADNGLSGRFAAVSYLGHFTLPRIPGAAGPPAISGSTTAGMKLAATSGAWTNSPTEITYRWLLCDAAGNACAALGDGTGPSYLLTGADVGHTLRVAVSAATVAGSGAQTSAPSGLVNAAATEPPTKVPLKTVGAFLTWNFGHHGKASTVKSLVVHSLERDETIRLSCTGRGCLSRRSRLAKHGHCTARICTRTQPAGKTAVLSLADLFQGMHLSAGSRVSIAVVASGRFGRIYTFTMRAHDGPVVKTTCLSPGSFTAVYGC